MVFAGNTISSYFFPFFLINNLSSLVSAVAAQIFLSTSVFAIPAAALTYEVKEKIEIQPLTDSRNKNKIMFQVIQSPIHVFMLFTR